VRPPDQAPLKGRGREKKKEVVVGMVGSSGSSTAAATAVELRHDPTTPWWGGGWPAMKLLRGPTAPPWRRQGRLFSNHMTRRVFPFTRYRRPVLYAAARMQVGWQTVV
jgi:hypothetical protein